MLDIKKLARVCTVQRFRANDIIFQEGDPGSEMFIILTGSVKVLISAPNGNKMVVSQLKAGDIFGEMALLEGLQRSATVQAVEETTTVAVNECNFESVIAQEPSLALRIMRSLSERIRKQNLELASYKEQLSLVFPKSDVSPPQYTAEIREEHKPDDSTECDGLGDLILHAGNYINVVSPFNDSAYLYEKEIVCPVCSQTNNSKLIRSSKLKLKRVEPDYRHVHTDFEPLWYIIWVCPHCYYANFSADFSNIADRDKNRIRELSGKVKERFGRLPAHPTLTQVLTGYYLTLFWLEQMTAPDPEKLGKLWLRLSWLYQDRQEAEMTMTATRKALDYFIKRIDNSTTKTTNAEDQYFYLLVGELSLKIGNIKEARNYFRQSIIVNGGNERMKQQAQNRIQELRSLV